MSQLVQFSQFSVKCIFTGVCVNTRQVPPQFTQKTHGKRLFEFDVAMHSSQGVGHAVTTLLLVVVKERERFGRLKERGEEF